MQAHRNRKRRLLAWRHDSGSVQGTASGTNGGVILMVHDIPSNADLFGSVLSMYGFDSEVVVTRYGLEASWRVREDGRRRRRCRGGGG
jgi:hypothetical protein